jgi:hypothetical protein
LGITSYVSSFFTASETLIDVSASIPVLVRHHKFLYTAFRVTYTFSLSLSSLPLSLALEGKLWKFSHKFKLLF